VEVTKRFFYIILFLLIPIIAFAATDTHYVTQSGAGNQDGTSAANAFSVSDFNSSANWDTDVDDDNKIGPGDTVYFSGTITTRLLLPAGYSGTSGNYITLDGWEGGTCDPVADHDATTFGSDDGVDLNACPSAAIIDLDDNETDAVYFQWNSYIIFQDFQIRDALRGIRLRGDGGDPSNVIIRRNYVHDIYTTGLIMTEGYNYDYTTIGGADGDGNFFYNCAERNRISVAQAQSINLGSDDIIFSYNEVSHDFVADESHNVIEIHTGNGQLIEYNTVSYPSSDACLSAKATGGSNKIIRFNKFHHGKYGISISTDQGTGNNDIYVYGNFMYDITDQLDNNGEGQALRVYRYYDNIHFWGNIISLADSRGIAVMKDVDPQGDVYIYNNTVYKAGNNTALNTSDKNGIYISYYSDLLDIRVANNIFSNCDASNYNAIYNVNVADAQISTFDYNTYYYPGQTPQIYWKGSTGSLMSWFTTNTIWGDNGEVADPGFIDANGADNVDGTPDDDLTLDGTNVDDGVDLSACFTPSVQGVTYTICYDDALDPSGTDWTTTPPTVVVVKQDDYGTGWERGAYVFGPTITVTATDDTATEENTTTGEWTIACSPDCAGETINFSYGGSATLNTDYNTDDEDGSKTITGASATITLTPVDDDIQDISEVAVLTIDSGAGYGIGSPSSANISIIDNDGAQNQGIAGITVDASGSGNIVYDSTGSGSWSR